MKNVIVSLGGSLIFDNGIDVKFLKDFSSMVKDLSKNYNFVIVVGGGRIARDYIDIARKNGMDEYNLDRIGILATKINAMLVKSFFSGMDGVVFFDAIEGISNFRVALMGGTEPGHTTDTVSMLVAEYLNEKVVINATSVDGIYDKDPKKFSDARLIEKISYRELIELLSGNNIGAGPNVVLDLLSIKIAERSGISIKVINGRNMENMKRAIEGKEFIGTTVGP